jgi:hypothetical protein
MMSAGTTHAPGREFDKFLFASVGDDGNGMPLTVLSALARMDVDPWEEASKLAQLSRQSAVTQLASLLGALRNAPAAGLDLARIAAPLIALLPSPRDHVPPTLKPFTQGQEAPTGQPAAVSTLLTVVTCGIFMLLSQWLMGSLQAPEQVQAPPNAAGPVHSSNVPASSDEGPLTSTK